MGRHYDRAVNAKKLINASAQFLDGNDALEAMTLYSPYPKFEDLVGETLEVGAKLVYGGQLWTVRQSHLAQAHYPPSTDTASLYERIDETHKGTIDDPIPYDINLAVTAGFYYIEDGLLYLCTRDSGNPLYHKAANLVGHYFELVT